jgi:hypothetical protein
MGNKYIDGYFEEDYFETFMAITPIPDPPLESDPPAVFVENGGAFLGSLPRMAREMNAAAVAMNANGTNSTSTNSHTIASSGSKTFTVQIGKSYVPGMTVRAAVTADGTKWMQGDVTAYDAVTGALTIVMNASTGSGTYSAWTLSLSSSASTGGSLTQDYSVKSLTHAIGTAIASATTINLSMVTGNLVHVTGSNEIQAATMTAGKDVWVIFDGTLQLSYHSLNLRLNSGGANVTVIANDMALFAFDGTVVRVTVHRANGKAIVETVPPAGIPVGTIIAFARSSPPAGYLACPIAATNISRVTYSDLFAAIGTTWGTGDGATTFGMPWFWPGYSMLQANSGVPTQAVGKGTTGEVKAHTHNYSDVDNTGSVSTGGSFVNSVGNVTTKSTTSTGGAENLAAGHYVLICVKYLWG